MKIGMNLLLYTTAPDESHFPIVERLRELGYDGAEWPLLSTDRKTAEKIGQFNQRMGLASTAVTAFGPGTNPISDDPNERKAAANALRERVELAATVGATCLCGPFVQVLGGFSGSAPTSTEWSRAVEYLRAAADHAASHKVTLVVEAVNRFEIYLVNTMTRLRQLCDEVGHPNVKGMFDSFHANIEEKNMRDAVLALGPQLKHVHISENDRGVPGSSKCIQWDDIFQGLKDAKYDGWLTIEAFGDHRPDLAGAAKIWRPLFQNADDLTVQGIAFIRKMIASSGLGK